MGHFCEGHRVPHAIGKGSIRAHECECHRVGVQEMDAGHEAQLRTSAEETP
jgi:hypothetical protein